MDWVETESLVHAETPKTENKVEIKTTRCEWKKWVTLGMICICAIIAFKAKEIVHFCINSFNDLKHKLYKPSAPAKAISKDELMHDYLATQSFDVLNEMEEISVNCEASENAAKDLHDTQLFEINEDEVQVLNHKQIKTDSSTQNGRIIEEVIEEVDTEDGEDAGNAEDGVDAEDGAESLVNMGVQGVTDDEPQIPEKKQRKRKPKAT